jgi:hypothetical protein
VVLVFGRSAGLITLAACSKLLLLLLLLLLWLLLLLLFAPTLVSWF